MDKNQNKNLNEEPSDECEAIAGDISADWEIDKAGNAYRSGDKFREYLADLRDEFKESS
jgi:hypothetical protein